MLQIMSRNLNGEWKNDLSDLVTKVKNGLDRPEIPAALKRAQEADRAAIVDHAAAADSLRSICAALFDKGIHRPSPEMVVAQGEVDRLAARRDATAAARRKASEEFSVELMRLMRPGLDRTQAIALDLVDALDEICGELTELHNHATFSGASGALTGILSRSPAIAQRVRDLKASIAGAR